MAGRSIHELLRLAAGDYRFFMGTYRDFSSNGRNGTPAASMTMGRRIGQVVAAIADESVDVVTLPSQGIADDTAYSFEFAGTIRPGGFNTGRIFDGPSVAYHDLAVQRVFWTCGITLSTPPGSVASEEPVHLVGSKDAAGNGEIFLNGVSLAAGAVGTAGLDGAIALFNNAGLIRDLRVDATVMRFFATQVDADEAARLYEHSRIQLWPGAPKRSGIWSPVV